MNCQISNGVDHLHWKGMSVSKPCFNSIPTKALIAPSRNLLSKEAFANRTQTISLDEKVQKIMQEQDLIIPKTFSQAATLSNHCVAMSLHFLKRFRQSKDIFAAAKVMQEGANEECAKTSLIYTQLFKANVDRIDDCCSDEEFLSELREVAAKTLDLTFSEETTLRYPFEEIFPYLQKELASGEYVIPLPSHVVALVKDDHGNLVLFDPNQGTVNLGEEKGKEWFLRLLKQYKVHLSEKLPLLKVADYQMGKVENPKKFEITLSEEKPELTFEKEKGRWGNALFKWRGKTHRLPWDSQTGYIYNKDSMRLLRIKCAMLIPRFLTDTTIRTCYHVALAVFRTLALPFAMVQGRKKAGQQLNKIGQSVADIFRAPFYGILGASAAFYGIFKPLDGRRLYGYFERCLNRQNDGVNLRDKYYVAPCFTPWNFEAGNDQQATTDALKKIILRYEHFQGTPAVELFLGWRRALPCFK